jgi:hypothetical protein
MTNLCDLCGKAISDRGRARDRCQANLGSDEAMAYGCKYEPLFDCLKPGADGEFVREALRAPLLREALREALEQWKVWLSPYASQELIEREETRIAELRAKFLGTTFSGTISAEGRSSASVVDSDD